MPLPVKRDREHLTAYTWSLWFHRYSGNWTSMKWLGSMRRERGKKRGDGESQTLKKLYGKFKIVEKGSHGCYGSWSGNF